MNRSETARLLALVQTFDRRTVGEADVAAWTDVLADVGPADAQAAVRAHFRESRQWLMPADVRARVRAIRDDRLARAPVEAPPAETTDDGRAYRAALHRGIQAIADRRHVDRALGGGSRPDTPPEKYRTARAAADGHDETRAAALRVACPWCCAHVGQGCTVPQLETPLTRRSTHHARMVAAGLAEPPTDPEPDPQDPA